MGFHLFGLYLNESWEKGAVNFGSGKMGKGLSCLVPPLPFSLSETDGLEREKKGRFWRLASLAWALTRK